MEKAWVLITCVPGRDFYNGSVSFRGSPAYEDVACTAAQIPS